VHPVSQWHVPIFLAVLAQCSAFVMEEYLIEGKRSKAYKRFIKELGRRDVALDDSANEPHVRLNARDIHARAWHRLEAHARLQTVSGSKIPMQIASDGICADCQPSQPRSRDCEIVSGTFHATAASHQFASGARRARGALADDVRRQKVCTVLSHSAPKWSEARTALHFRLSHNTLHHREMLHDV
jgi:hypothetical protein